MLNQKKIKSLKTRKSYLKALKRFEVIFQAKHGSEESNEADMLSVLIKQYEDIKFVIS